LIGRKISTFDLVKISTFDLAKNMYTQEDQERPRKTKKDQAARKTPSSAGSEGKWQERERRAALAGDAAASGRPVHLLEVQVLRRGRTSDKAPGS
jgi:hypothetical protein